MKVIHLPRQASKTTELIEMAHNGRYKIIVCHSREEADRIFQVAMKMDKKVPLPITYDEYLKGQFHGKNIESFLIDNVDMLIAYISKGVPVEAISISKMNTLKIIEGQMEDFQNKGKIYWDSLGGISTKDVINWHKQSIIQILESEIDRKSGMKKELLEVETGIFVPVDRHISLTGVNGYNQALEEDISHLTNLLDSLK